MVKIIARDYHHSEPPMDALENESIAENPNDHLHHYLHLSDLYYDLDLSDLQLRIICYIENLATRIAEFGIDVHTRTTYAFDQRAGGSLRLAPIKNNLLFKMTLTELLLFPLSTS